MNEKPQEAPRDEQENLLEQVFTQGLEKMNAPAQTAANQEAPADETPPASNQADSGGTASPAEKKNKRSAVYLYLLILFGAAFLMLLLAYFVQQRSNENTISDLRDSMNLSRQELLDEIRELGEEKDALDEKIGQLQNELTQWQERYEEKDGELTDLENLLYDTQEKVYSWRSFWELERYYQARDYESCAAILLLQEQGQYRYSTPAGAQAREEEIVQAVIDAGILDEDYQRHPDSYNDLLDAYFTSHPVLYGEEGDHGPTGWSNIIYDYDVISRFT